MRKGILLFAFLLWPAIASAWNAGETYPKLAVYTSRLNEMRYQDRAALARYDLMVHLWTIRPEMLSELRRVNPKLRVFHQLQPQYAAKVESANPWWLADTLWSPARKMQWYAYKNDWYLRTTSGQLIDAGGNDYIINWTPFCSNGTYKTSKGLRASQWYPKMLSEICLSGNVWPAMDWNRTDGLRMNGIVFEILADCLGSYGHLDVLKHADPNHDGRAEGVWSTCSTGGSTQPLTGLMRMENALFWSYLRTLFPAEIPIIINENSNYLGPAWRTQLSGMKLENWDPKQWKRWWYGADGFGYLWAEKRMGRSPSLPDNMRGWDMSILRLAWDKNRALADNERRARFALGTTLLGDGYFYLSPGDDRMAPTWAALDLNLGTPIEDFRIFANAVGDTIWIRDFTHGSVRVNPNERYMMGVPPGDARFLEW